MILSTRRILMLLLAVASVMLILVSRQLHLVVSGGDVVNKSSSPPRRPRAKEEANDDDDALLWSNGVPLNDLPAQLHLPEEATERSDERFTCANMSLLKLLDDAPFAHGWNKEVWRAMWPENLNKMYTVKRRYLSRAKTKEALERRRSYGLAVLKRELELLDKLKHWNIATSYGGCLEAPRGADDDDRVAIVVEYVDAYSMKELMAQRLPWCVWTKLAIDLGSLIKYLDQSENGPAVHCDWKPDQFVVRKKDYRVVLVDVDSIQFYRRGGAYLEEHACNGSSKAECAQFEGECFQETARAMVVPDAQCDVTRGRCIGFNTSSMVWALGAGMMLDFLGGAKDLFLTERLGPAPEMVRGTKMFVETFADAIRNATHDEQRARWSVDELLVALRLLYAQGNGKQCMTKWQWHKRFV
jgi:hypothetical protein